MRLSILSSARGLGQESGVRSQETGVRSQESGDGSQESGDGSQGSGVRRRETGVRSQEHGFLVLTIHRPDAGAPGGRSSPECENDGLDRASDSLAQSAITTAIKTVAVNRENKIAVFVRPLKMPTIAISTVPNRMNPM